MAFRGLRTETVAYKGHNGDVGEAYLARPAEAGRVPGVVVIHHLPGWDEWTVEVCHKLAHHGYATIAPSLYFRLGDGASEDVVKQVRAEGGMPDDQVVGDVAGAAAYLRALPEHNGKLGVIGFCSGGRHTYLSACRLRDFQAAIDCWGGDVVVDDPSRLTARKPVAPVDLTESLSCPLLGLFGNEDHNPTAAQVDATEAALKRFGKTYEFHRYDNAGHAFFAWYRPAYRVEPAIDGWNKVFAFFARHLAG